MSPLVVLTRIGWIQNPSAPDPVRHPLPSVMEPLSDAALAAELAAIGAQLETLASSASDAQTIGAELGAIRAQLRLLARQNAEVGERLGISLGLVPPH